MSPLVETQNQKYNYPTPEVSKVPTQLSAWEEEVKTQEGLLDNLESMAGLLTEQLEPIMLPPLETEKCGTTHPPSSRVVTQIAVTNERIRRVTALLLEIRLRLQI